MAKIFDFNLFHKAREKAHARASSLVGFLLKKEGQNPVVVKDLESGAFLKEAQKIIYESERYIQQEEEKGREQKD